MLPNGRFFRYAQRMSDPVPIIGTLTISGRIDKSLAQATALSRERIKGLIAQGAVTIGRTVATSPSATMQAGAHFTIHLPPAEPAQAQAQDIPLDIVHEDEHLIVVDKPADMVVHPAAGNADGTLVNALLHHCDGKLSGIGGVARPGIVHRIDKDTSGLLVVAKSAIAHEGLASQFADHSITRRYVAVCNGHPEPPRGTVEGRIGRSDANRKKMAVLPPSATRGKHAVTHYRVLEKLNQCSMLECVLETSRTHQIRVHCASIGHALTGDPVYGSIPARLRQTLDRIGFARQALHAATLGFHHPIDGEYAEYTSDLPLDMKELIDAVTR